MATTLHSFFLLRIIITFYFSTPSTAYPFPSSRQSTTDTPRSSLRMALVRRWDPETAALACGAVTLALIVIWTICVFVWLGLKLKKFCTERKSETGVSETREELRAGPARYQENYGGESPYDVEHGRNVFL
ncbi:unnamed protein product [Periconia digitata]|uniref:Uncharacterized protein n=1 Tax=Periconia digitata TaxID=1303443 RepID=A0A9W4XYX2_9PLEO|nr:unnamed protein product [Periconia digitata]